MKNLIVLLIIILGASLGQGLKKDEAFSVNKTLCSQNWEFFGTSLCFKSKLRILPELSNRFGLIWARNTLKYKDAFSLEITYSIEHNNTDNSPGEAFAIWLLRENPHFNRQNYTESTASFFGFTDLYKGVGVFLTPNKTDNTSSNIYGMESKKLFRYDKSGITKNGKSCSIDMSQKTSKIRIYFSQDYLYVYKKAEKNKFHQCFSFQETFEKDKEFYIGLSASNKGAQTFSVDILEVKVLSDIINEQPIPEVLNESHHGKDIIKHHHEHEHLNNQLNNSEYLQKLYKIQNDLKNTVLSIKQFNHKSFKDIREGMRKQPKTQDLLVFSIDQKILNMKLENIEDNLIGFQEKKRGSTHNKIGEKNKNIRLREELQQLAAFSIKIEDKINDLIVNIKNKRSMDNSLKKKLKALNEIQDGIRPKIQKALLDTELVMEELIKTNMEPDIHEDLLEYILIVLLGLVIFLSVRAFQRASGSKKHSY